MIRFSTTTPSMLPLSRISFATLWLAVGIRFSCQMHDRAQAEFLRRKMASRNLPCTVLNLLGAGQDGVEWTYRSADSVAPLFASA